MVPAVIILFTFSSAGLRAEGLKFDDLLKLSLTNNLSVRVAQRDIETVIQNLRQVDLQYLPRLTFTLDTPQITIMSDASRSNAYAQAPQYDGSLVLTERIPSLAPRLPYHAEASLAWNFTRLQSATNGGLTNQDKLSTALDLGLSVTLFREDTVLSNRNVQKEKLQLSKLSFAQVGRQYSYELRRAYYDYCNERETVENERRRLAGDRESIEVARQKFRAGIIAEYSLIDYEVDFRRSEVRLSDAERAWGEKDWNLFYVLYLPRGSLGAIDTIADEAITNLEPAPAQLLAWALSNTLDLANLRFSMFQNQQQLQTLQQNLIPKLTLAASLNWGLSNSQPYTNAFTPSKSWIGSLPGSPTLNAPLSATFSANLVAPLFTDWWINRSQLEVAKNTRETLKLQVEDRARTLDYRIRVDLLDLANQYFRYRKSKENFNLYRKSYELSRQRFEVGVISSWEMITTKNQYYDNFNAYIDAKYAYLARLAAMERDYGLKVPGL